MIQKVLAALPGDLGERMNRDMPTLLGRRGGDPSQRAIPIAELHGGPVARLGLPPGNDEILELGTGYNLFMALPFALLGYRVTTLDLHRDLSAERVRQLVASLESRVAELAAVPGARRSESEIRAALVRLRAAPDLDAMLREAGIAYHAPYAMEEFASGNADRFGYVVSHCVFEHIPPELFPPILTMLRTVSAPHAIYSHQVDMRDHRSSEGFLVDRRLSYLDYLTFSAARWRFWNGNDLAYTNRWRKSDYCRVLEEHGFPVIDCVDTCWPGTALPLSRERLHPDFRQHPDVELRVMASLVVGRVAHAS